MKAQTEKKKPERESKSPSERTSSPPGKIIGGTATQRLNKELESIGGLIEGVVDEKVENAVGPVSREVDGLKGRLDRNENTYDAALGEAVRREEAAADALEEIETNTKTLEGVKDEFGDMKTKFVEHCGTVEEHKNKVNGIELTVEQLHVSMAAKEKGLDFRVRELEYDTKEKIKRIEASAKAEVDKLSGVFIEAMKEFQLIQDGQKGIHKRINAVEKGAEDAKSIAEQARTIAHDVEAHVEAAKDIAGEVASRQEEMVSDVSDLEQGVEQIRRTSMLPPPAPASVEDKLGEPSGVERMPPPPVKKVSNGREVEEMLEENNQTLDEKEVKILELKEVTAILLEGHRMEGIKEAEAVTPLDITKYPGYEKLTEVSKKRLEKLAGQATKMREQGAELKVLYEATGRLARKTDVEMKIAPPREAKQIAIENEQKLESATMVNGKIANAIKEISTELKKQSYKAIIIFDVLKAVAKVNTEGN